MDIQWEVSNVALYMLKKRAYVRDVIADTDMSWGLYRALAWAPYFESQFDLVATLEAIVFKIRKAYPEWKELLQTQAQRDITRKTGTTIDSFLLFLTSSADHYDCNIKAIVRKTD